MTSYIVHFLYYRLRADKEFTLQRFAPYGELKSKKCFQPKHSRYEKPTLQRLSCRGPRQGKPTLQGVHVKGIQVRESPHLEIYVKFLYQILFPRSSYVYYLRFRYLQLKYQRRGPELLKPFEFSSVSSVFFYQKTNFKRMTRHL